MNSDFEGSLIHKNTLVFVKIFTFIVVREKEEGGKEGARTRERVQVTWCSSGGQRTTFRS